MKILLTGGGTGGHFYPIIAVAEALRKQIREQRFIEATIYYMAPSPYNERLLLENDIIYKKCFAGKMRRYFSLLNITDLFKTATGIVKAMIDVYSIFPDVIFGKGGYVSFPVLLAARFFGIPVVIHESDSKPGKVNAWAGKFARRIAVSYESAGAYFPKEKVAHTGNPIRKEIMQTAPEGAREFFGMTDDAPVVLVLGGSQGSKRINDAMIDILGDLVQKYYVIHQTGKDNFEEMTRTANVVLLDNPYKARYKPLAYLNDVTLRKAAGAATIVISRAGSTIFEIASWGKASIIIPIPEGVSHDQKSNALSYAATGAATVIEEANLTPHILLAEINRIVDHPEIREKMEKGTARFRQPDAADKIAGAILNVALEHIV